MEGITYYVTYVVYVAYVAYIVYVAYVSYVVSRSAKMKFFFLCLGRPPV